MVSYLLQLAATESVRHSHSSPVASVPRVSFVHSSGNAQENCSELAYYIASNSRSVAAIARISLATAVPYCTVEVHLFVIMNRIRPARNNFYMDHWRMPPPEHGRRVDEPGAKKSKTVSSGKLNKIFISLTNATNFKPFASFFAVFAQFKCRLNKKMSNATRIYE